jgi:hypothetical protein
VSVPIPPLLPEVPVVPVVSVMVEPALLEPYDVSVPVPPLEAVVVPEVSVDELDVVSVDVVSVEDDCSFLWQAVAIVATSSPAETVARTR